MPTPESPSLDYSFTAFQEAQGNNQFPGTQLDAALANLKASIDELIAFTGAVIRDDERLQNGIVGRETLGADVLSGVAPPRPWETATVYVEDETVTTNNGLYICLSSHTSDVFATDLLLGRWANLAVWSPLTEVADNTISTAKLVAGVLSADTAGRAKMANGYLTGEKVADGALTRAKVAANFGLVPIGATLPWDGPLPPAGWVFKFGQALSRATYLDLLNALTATAICNTTNGNPTISGVATDLRNLGLEGAKIEGPGIPAGATVSSITLDTIVISTNATAPGAGIQVRIFPHGNGDGSTTFNVPDDRDYAGVGRGNMGGTAAGRVLTTGDGASDLNTARLGDTGGVDRHTLTAAQIPDLTGTTDTAAAHTHPYTDTVRVSGESGATGVNFTSNSGEQSSGKNTSAAGAHSHTVTIDGGGQAHPNMQPGRVENRIIFTGVV